MVLAKGVWLWVCFYPGFPVPEIWFLNQMLAGLCCTYHVLTMAVCTSETIHCCHAVFVVSIVEVISNLTIFVAMQYNYVVPIIEVISNLTITVAMQ